MDARTSFVASLEDVADAALVLSGDDTVEWASVSVFGLLGWAEGQLMGNPFAMLVDPPGVPPMKRRLQWVRDSGEPDSCQCMVRREDGDFELVHARLAAVSGEHEGNVVVTLNRPPESDGLDPRRHLHLLPPAAQQSGLQDLVNAMERLAGRSPRGRGINAYATCSIGGFAGVSETMGEHAGELLVRRIIDRLLGACRSSDAIARTGGGEALIALYGVKDAVDAGVVLSRMQARAGRAIPFQTAELDPQVSISAGLLDAPGCGTRSH